MARSLHDILTILPADPRTRIEARATEIIEEIESLKAIRKLPGHPRVKLAAFSELDADV